MKKLLLTLLFSFFLLISHSVFAGDISDFEIEGISIGDSLLDYMTEDEILKEIELSLSLNEYYYLKEPNKYVEVYLYKNFPNYDFLTFFVKNNPSNNYITEKDKKYEVLSIRGIIPYNEDFNTCIAKRNEIVEGLSNIFPNADKLEEFIIHPHDPSGDSFIEAINFKFDLGSAAIANCTNYEETFRINNNLVEGLSISIKSKEIVNWITDY